MYANRYIARANFFGSPSCTRVASSRSPRYRLRVFLDGRSGSLYAGWMASTMALRTEFVRKRAGWMIDIWNGVTSISCKRDGANLDIPVGVKFGSQALSETLKPLRRFS